MAKKIMVIDDDDSIVQYLTTLFENNGYVTCTAKDGASALGVLKEEKPDLITLDLEMPKAWGTRFYRKASQSPEFKDTPVIVISGLPSIKYSIKNAVAFVNKPFDPDKVVKLVKENIGS